MALVYPDIILSGNPDAYGIVQETHVTGARTVQTLTELYAISDAILSPSGNNTNNDALGQIWYVSNDTTNNGSYRLKDWTNRKSAGGWDKLIVTGGELGQSGVTSVNNLTGDISIVGDGAIDISKPTDSNNIKIIATNVVRTDGTTGVLNINLREYSSIKRASLHAENSNGFSFEIQSGETGTGEFSINATEMLLIQNNMTDNRRVGNLIYRAFEFPNYDENNNLDIKLECNSNQSYQGLYFSTGEVTLLASNYDHDDASDLTKAASIRLWNNNASYAPKITFGIPSNLDKLFTYEFDTNIGNTSQQNKTIATVDYVDSKVGDVQSDRIKSANEYAVAVATESGENGTLTLAASGENGQINLNSKNIILDGAVKFSTSGEGIFRIVNKTDDRDIFAISNTNDATNVSVSVGDIVNSFTWKGKTVATTDQIKTYTGTAPIVVSSDNKISINTSDTITDSSTTVPTTAAVNTAIEALKTQVAGGIIYKGKTNSWSVSGDNIIVDSGEGLPSSETFKNGYMVMLNESGEVNGAKYDAGDYVIYSGTGEIAYNSGTDSHGWNLPIADCSFINSQDSNVAKTDESNNWTGFNIFHQGITTNYVVDSDGTGLCIRSTGEMNLECDSEINIFALDTINIGGRLESGNKTPIISVSGKNTSESSDDTIVFSVVPTIGTGETAKTLATTDQIKTITLPEGTKQLPTDGSYTINDVVVLLNKIAAALGAPVHS